VHRVKQASVVVGTVLLALAIGLATRSWSIEPGFYDAVAQVIPILLLVAAVEGRFFVDRPARPAFSAFLVRWFLVLPLFAEGAALTAIARGSDDVLLRGTVFAGALLSVSLFLAFAFDGPPPKSRDGRRG
jgi:hypothetical protein